MQQAKHLLIVHYGEQWIRGSESCLLNLISTLCHDYIPVVWTNNKVMKQQLQAQGILTYLDTFELIHLQQGTFNVKHWMSLCKQASQIIDEHEIKLIHVNSGAPCQWMTLVAKAKGVPMLCQLHSPYNLHDRFTLTLHSAQRIIAVSHAVATSLLQEGYPKHKLSVVHNGIEYLNQSPCLNIRSRLAIPHQAKVLISVGSLIKRKGFDKLIQALALLNNNQHQHHLVIVGEGSERLNLIALIHQLQLQNQVHLVGEQSNVQQWLQGGCDLFVSGATSEAFGLVLLEAAQAGLAVVAPNVGGIPEVIQHKHTGLLYNQGEQAIPEMVDAIGTLLSDPILRNTLAINGAKIAQQRFSLASNTAHIQAIYSQLISGKVEQTWFSWSCALFRPVRTFCKTRCLNPIKALFIKKQRGLHEA
ncbi:glycosyltransferase [Vibrio rarus]|uniref:glycosyltransferase n=1 Tax=Vibrio rarus TaxID=413403 RepID=UPI0021C3079E|nr:glycosyltransferase [Vibrio rarus]